MKKIFRGFFVARAFAPCMPQNSVSYMYTRVRALRECVKNTRKKKFEKKSRKYLAVWFRCCNFAPSNKPKT